MEALRNALIDRSEGKLPSTPPNGTGNAVLDLELTDTGGGTADLTWHYYNLGDYNQDSVVNVADITPIAMNFGATVPAGDENLLLAVVDGSGNDAIDIADITPIAMNYGAELAHYNIENASAQAGPYSLVQQVTIASALDADTARAHFQVNIAPVYNSWYRVIPADTVELTGPPSNTVLAVAPAWVHTYGLSSSEQMHGITFDEVGNIYAVGATSSSGVGNFDVLLLKYSPYGDFIWARTWGGVNTDEGYSVCYSPATQSLVIIGQTESFGAGVVDLVLLSFSTDGDLQMQRTWGGLGTEYSYRLMIDSGFIYIVGSTNSYGAGDHDILVMKVSSFGSVVWAKTWGGGSFDAALGLAINSSGHICVGGYTTSFGAGNGDVAILTLDSSGNILSQNVWGTGSVEMGSDIALDSDDNMLVSGICYGPDQNSLVLKLSPTGDVLWAKALVGANMEAAMAIAVDSYGNSSTYGATNSSSLGGTDLCFAAYTSTGELIAQAIWGTPLDDLFGDFVLGADGYLYCVGRAPSSQGTWAISPLIDEEITTGLLGSVSAMETSPGALLTDIVGVSQAPVGEVLDTGGGGEDCLLMKMLLLS